MGTSWSPFPRRTLHYCYAHISLPPPDATLLVCAHLPPPPDATLLVCAHLPSPVGRYTTGMRTSPFPRRTLHYCYAHISLPPPDATLLVCAHLPSPAGRYTIGMRTSPVPRRTLHSLHSICFIFLRGCMFFVCGPSKWYTYMCNILMYIWHVGNAFFLANYIYCVCIYRNIQPHVHNTIRI